MGCHIYAIKKNQISPRWFFAGRTVIRCKNRKFGLDRQAPNRGIVARDQKKLKTELVLNPDPWSNFDTAKLASLLIKQIPINASSEHLFSDFVLGLPNYTEVV